MANDSNSGGIFSLVATAIGSIVLIRSANKAASSSTVTHVEADRRPSSEPSAATVLATPPRPDGGLALKRWQFERYQRSHRALGFPLGVLKKFLEDKAGNLAALVSYYGFFSLFPLMLAFVSILGFLLEPDQQQRFAQEAASQIPVVGDTIVDVVEANGSIGKSTLGIVIGLGGALWSGLKMIDAMQNALNNVWDIPPVDRPNIVKRRLRSFAMLLVLGGGIVGSVVVSSIGTYLSALPGGGRVAIWTGSALVSVLLYFVAFQLLTDRRLPWKSLWPGALVGGVGWWALQTFGGPYIQRVADQAKSFGDFAAIIALLTFLFIAAQVSILGAEISAVYARGLWPRSWTKGDLTETDLRTFEMLANSTQQDDSYSVRVVPVNSSTSSER